MANGNDCTLHKFERNRYFYGKLMTVRDFEMEQSYMNGKRHLVNRLVLGDGVVCGLKVASTFDASASRLNLAVSSGVAIDCAGREIVVEQDVTVPLDAPVTATQAYCLWLSRVDCRIEPAPAPVTESGNVCEEVCCYSRVREEYALSVEPWTGAIPTADEAYAGSFTTGVTDSLADIRAVIKGHFDAITEDCAECTDPCRVAVALLVRQAADWTGAVNVIQNNVVHNNPELFELVRRHIADVGNPHMTTAAQTGALVSVDGVSNPGGNVDLISANAIQITPNNAANSITIGETHSARTDNPHNTTAAQTGALTGIQVSGGAVLENPGGAVNVAAGANVTLTADASTRTVTIAAAGGAPISTGVIIFHPQAEQMEMVSDLIDAGLGAGPLCVNLGLEQGQNEPIFVGPFEVFESFNFPQVLLGAQVQPTSGRFRTAIRFQSAPQISSLRVRWWAYRPTVDMGTVTEKDKEKEKEKEKEFEKIGDKVTDKGLEKISDKTFEKVKETDKAAEKTFETKLTDKVAETKVTDKTVEKAVEKTVEKALEKALDGVDVVSPGVLQPGVVISPVGISKGKTFIRPGERPDVGAVKETKKAKPKKGSPKKGR